MFLQGADNMFQTIIIEKELKLKKEITITDYKNKIIYIIKNASIGF